MIPRRRLFAIAAASIAPFFFAALPARAEPSTYDELPPVARPEGLSVYLEARLSGTLTYVCGRTDAFAWAWILRASDATLRDGQDRKIGSFAERTNVIPPPLHPKSSWNGSDGGKVVAALEARAQLPGESRVWERYTVKSREGAGRFTVARSIVRVSAAWRIRPETVCDAARSGAAARLPYSGAVLFFK